MFRRLRANLWRQRSEPIICLAILISFGASSGAQTIKEFRFRPIRYLTRGASRWVRTVPSGSPKELRLMASIKSDGSPLLEQLPNISIPINLILQQGIVAGPDGALWFTVGGTLAGKIGRITVSGSVTTYNAAAGSIVVGPDGALWFAEGGAGKILGGLRLAA